MVSKFIAIALFASLSCTLARADLVWSNVLMNPGVCEDDNISVPVASTCEQFGMAFRDGYIENSGPLGNFVAYDGGNTTFGEIGPISAGIYAVRQSVEGSGYTGTFIYW